MRECGECSACCQGWVTGTVYGKQFNVGNPCYFLHENKCTIYEHRAPDPCRRFMCSWLEDTTNTFPDWMRPDKFGMIIRENTTASGIPYLAFIDAGKEPTTETIQWIINYHETTNKNIGVQYKGKWHLFGDDSFINDIAIKRSAIRRPEMFVFENAKEVLMQS